MTENTFPQETSISDLLERARKLREAGERLIREADSLWMLARSARNSNTAALAGVVSSDS